MGDERPPGDSESVYIVWTEGEGKANQLRGVYRTSELARKAALQEEHACLEPWAPLDGSTDCWKSGSDIVRIKQHPVLNEVPDLDADEVARRKETNRAMATELKKKKENDLKNKKKKLKEIERLKAVGCVDPNQQEKLAREGALRQDINELETQLEEIKKEL